MGRGTARLLSPRAPGARFVALAALRQVCGADAQRFLARQDLLPDQEPLDWPQIAAELDGDVRELTKLTDAIAEMDRVAQEALTAKREARKSMRRTRVNVARRMEGRYRQVGLDDAADQLRLKVRRASSPEQPEPETQPEPAAEPEPGTHA